VLVRLVRACLNGSFDEALEMQRKYHPLFRGLMSLETNPVPVKEAVALQGHCTSEFRLPLVGLKADQKKILNILMEEFSLL